MIKRIFTYAKNNALISQFSCFAFVGIINTSLNYLVYIFLLKITGLYYIFAGICGFIVGAITAFFLNRAWTFKSQICIKKGLVKYFIVQIFCLVIHIFIQFLSTEFLAIPVEFSQFPSILIVMFVNFFLIRKIVFY